MCVVLEEQKYKKQVVLVFISGFELVVMMKIGIRDEGSGLEMGRLGNLIVQVKGQSLVRVEFKFLIVMLWNEGYRMDF